MSQKNDLLALAEHLKVKDYKTLSNTKLYKAVREAVTKKWSADTSITEAAEKIGSTSSGVTKTETKAVEVTKDDSAKVVSSKSVEVISPNQNIDVRAPNFVVNVPPATVSVQHGDFTLGHFCRQALLWGNGAVMGGMAATIFFLSKGFLLSP